jgi:hypothetical protein
MERETRMKKKSERLTVFVGSGRTRLGVARLSCHVPRTLAEASVYLDVDSLDRVPVWGVTTLVGAILQAWSLRNVSPQRVLSRRVIRRKEQVVSYRIVTDLHLSHSLCRKGQSGAKPVILRHGRATRPPRRGRTHGP